MTTFIERLCGQPCVWCEEGLCSRVKPGHLNCACTKCIRDHAEASWTQAKGESQDKRPKAKAKGQANNQRLKTHDIALRSCLKEGRKSQYRRLSKPMTKSFCKAVKGHCRNTASTETWKKVRVHVSVNARDCCEATMVSFTVYSFPLQD